MLFSVRTDLLETTVHLDHDPIIPCEERKEEDKSAADTVATAHYKKTLLQDGQMDRQWEIENVGDTEMDDNWQVHVNIGGGIIGTVRAVWIRLPYIK